MQGFHLAPAKVNLALHVTRRLDCGMHEIDTLAAFASLGDRLSVSEGRGESDSLSVRGPFSSGLDDGPGNLALKAASALRRASRKTLEPVSIELEKNLPLASGLGGGSADAAATLRILANRWGIEEEVDLFSIAEGLGSDAPMCLFRSPLRAGGKGERIAPIRLAGDFHALFANPGIPSPSGLVYERLERRENPPVSMDMNQPVGLPELEAMRNDLESPAISLAPAIGEVLERLRGFPDCLLSRMSGSGATCYGLFSSPAEAKAAGKTLQAERKHWWTACGSISAESDS